MKLSSTLLTIPKALANPYISRSSSTIWKTNSGNYRNSSSVRHEKTGNKELNETNMFGDSKAMYDEQYPPLPDIKGKIKVGIDLRTQSEKLAEKSLTAASLQLATNLTSQQDENSQPIGYEKKNFNGAERSTSQQDEKSQPIDYEEKNFNHADRSTGQQDEKSKPVSYEEMNFKENSSTSQQDKYSVPHAYRNPKGMGKRKIRIDMETQSEKLGEKPVTAGSLQLAANFTSQQDEKSQLIGYEEKIFYRANRSTSQQDENYVPRMNRNLKGTRGERSSDRAEKKHPIRPFDICKPNKSKFLKGENPVLERNMGIEYPITETRQLLRPGMVLLTNYLSVREQVDIINKCRELGLGPGGFYQPGYEDGAKLRLHMMCFGRRWDPVTKYEHHIRSDDPQSIGIPGEFVSLVERALSVAHSLIKKNEVVNNVKKMLHGMSPDICIVNFYTEHGRLGLHQDRDESKNSLRRGLPVVSFSVGDSANFLYGDDRDINKADSIILKSGDVLIFGGESRHVFHGITSVIANSAPPALLTETKLRPGRLNLTFRQY